MSSPFLLRLLVLAGGVPRPGVLPIFTYYKKSTDGTTWSTISAPVWFDHANGKYTVAPVQPGVGESVEYVIDAGADADDRFIGGGFNHEDWFSANTDVLSSGLATAANLATAKTELDAVKAKTDNLPGTPASTGDVTAARDVINNKLGSPAGASVSADIASIKSDITNLSSKLATIRALLGANVFVDNPTFDGNGNPTGDRSRYYATAGEAQAPNTSTPLITLNYSAVWNGPERIVTEVVIVTQGG